MVQDVRQEDCLVHALKSSMFLDNIVFPALMDTFQTMQDIIAIPPQKPAKMTKSKEGAITATSAKLAPFLRSQMINRMHAFSRLYNATVLRNYPLTWTNVFHAKKEKSLIQPILNFVLVHQDVGLIKKLVFHLIATNVKTVHQEL
jgi:hypothetical protein